MMIASEVIAAAQAAQVRWGIPASVSLAQYGVESAWGRFEPPGSNNGFGIQQLPGLPFVAATSQEYRNGRLVPVVEYFAVFSSVLDAFDKHAELLATGRPYRTAMTFVKDPGKFVEAMAPVYATAPNYAGALLNIMNTMNLFQYDK
jgi:flagellum-specific peptidoglycan hydrolase FlgJ